MEMETFNIDELLVRVLANRANHEDIVFFSKWMEDGEHRAYFEKFKKVWNLASKSEAKRS